MQWCGCNLWDFNRVRGAVECQGCPEIKDGGDNALEVLARAKDYRN